MLYNKTLEREMSKLMSYCKAPSPPNTPNKKYFFPFLLTAIVIIYFRKIIFCGFFIPGLDAIVQNFPFKYFLAENLQNGHILLWCRSIGSGCPLYAEGQGSFFYPLNLLFLLFPPILSFNILLVFAFLVMELSTYFYCRIIELDRASSFFASIIFTFGSFTIFHLANSNLLYAMSWMSVCFCLIELFFRRANMLWILPAGFVFSLQLLAGFPQIALYSFLFAAAYFIFRMLTAAIPIKKSLGAALIAAVIGVGMGGIQLLPTMELAKVSSYKNVEFYQSHPEDMLTFINPYFFGNPTEKGYERNPVLFSLECHYIGILPIVMIFLSLPFIFRRRFAAFFFFAAVLTLVLIYAHPVFLLFAKFIPGLGLFRFPQRLYLLVQFSLAVMAGFAMQRIDKNYLRTVLIAVTMLELFIFGFSIHPSVESEGLMKEPLSAGFLKKDTDIYRIYPYKYFETHTMLFKKSAEFKTKFPHEVFMETQCPDTNILWGLDSAGLYHSLYLKRFVKFSQFIESGIKIHPSGALVPEAAVKLMGVENVKYVISAIPLESPFLKLAETVTNPPWADVFLYENTKFLPRIFISGKAVLVKDVSEMGEALTAFKPPHEVILEEDPGRTDYGRGKWSINSVTFSRDKVSFNAFSEAGGFLVFSDTYYPGWKALIDGAETHIYRANYRFKAVCLDAGHHFVEFIFEPPVFKLGLMITCFSAVLFATLTGVLLYRKLQ